MAREVLLVGSVPLRPAERVFEEVASRLGDLLPRMSDGDQHGWVIAAASAFARHPLLEFDRTVPISPGSTEIRLYRLRPGASAGELELGPYGYADTAAASYLHFRRLKEEGVIPAGTRFQVTLPGPGTSAYMVQLPAEVLLPLARRALAHEVELVAAAIPADELTIQIDVAMEAEHEEYLRRPDDFDTPIHEAFHWTHEQMAESVAWLANRVPPDVELGFHVCSMWHHYRPGGQDNAVIADTVRAIASRVDRPIGYFHVPTIPEHEAADFAHFRDLVPAGTTLYLGVIHASDGLEGARRRIEAAAGVVGDFGVASFCGLGIPAAQETTSESAVVAGSGTIQGAAGASIESVLELHREVALLD